MQEYVLEHPKAAKKGTAGASAEARSMLTCAELHAAGRGDLVRLIRNAGGSSTAAQVLRYDMMTSKCVSFSCAAKGGKSMQANPVKSYMAVL